MKIGAGLVALAAALLLVLSAAPSAEPSAKAAAGSAASAKTSSRTIEVEIVGSLTIAWSGDPARGCAARGLCGVHGSLEMLPSGASGSSGSGLPPLEVTDSGAAARVIDQAPDGSTTTCADLVPVDIMLIVTRVNGALRAVAQGDGSPQQPSAGRCAGPTASDLEALQLPARRVRAGYDLSGTTTFGAGPFTIIAVSTLRALVGSHLPGPEGLLTGTASSATSAPVSAPSPPPTHRVLQETAAVVYRIESMSGALTATFSALAPPLCEPLGACGTSGQLSDSLTAGGTLTFSGTRRVKRSTGEGAALSDLRAGVLRIDNTFATIPIDSTVSERLSGPAAAACSDTSVQQAFSGAWTSLGRRGVRLLLSPGVGGIAAPTSDALRTRGPGPSGSDVYGGVGGAGDLAAATVAAAQLGAPELTITFTASGAFTGAAYAGARGGAVVMRLVRIRQTGGTQRTTIVSGGSRFGFSEGQVVSYGSPTPVAQQSIPVTVSGQLTVAFHGDAAAGCAALGVCGDSGTLIWRPPSDGTLQLLSYRRGGGESAFATLTLPGQGSSPISPFSPGGTTTASVQTAGGPGAAAASCIDALATGTSFDLPVRGGDVTFALSRAEPSLLGTRCAGPRDRDIDPTLPAPTLTLSALRHSAVRAIGLEASIAFSSGGFTGTVQSTLTLVVGRAGPVKPFSSTGPTERYRELTVNYRAALQGTVDVRFSGASDPNVCALLGSCGVTGVLTMTPRVPHGHAEIIAYAPATRPERDLLAAVGLSHGDTGGVVASGSVSWSSGGTVDSVVAQASSTCHDSAPLGAGDMILLIGSGRLDADYVPLAQLGDSGATRCAGPEISAASPVGSFGIAAGEIPLREMAHRTVQLAMRAGPATDDDGYSVTSVPRLTLTLTRLTTRTRIVRLPRSTF
ncbi:MAG: hypothetical protein ACLP50_26475 [Solirubrobacteraceae bacterium]